MFLLHPITSARNVIHPLKVVFGKVTAKLVQTGVAQFGCKTMPRGGSPWRGAVLG